MNATRFLAVGASIWLVSCGTTGRDPLDRVVDSSRDRPVVTQQARSSAAAERQAKTPQPPSTPPPLREVTGRETRATPDLPGPRAYPATVRPTGDRIVIDALPQATAGSSSRAQGLRPVGTTGRVETTEGGRPTDDVLLDRVESLLAGDPRLRQIDVSVQGGIILLKGEVADPLARERAFTLAKSIAGSRGVIAKFSQVAR